MPMVPPTLRCYAKNVFWPAVALVLLALVIRHYFFPDQKKQIRSLFAHIAANASFDAEEHPFARLAAVRALLDTLSEDVSVNLLRPSGIEEVAHGKKGLMEKVTAARASLAQLAVSFSSFTITLKKDQAEVECTARAMGRDPGRDDYFLEVHRISCLLRKEAKGWRISRIQNIDPYSENESFD